MTDGVVTPPPGILRGVRLVIWDLDDTLWSGVISEGPITLIEPRAELVRRLTRAGIICSVASNNDRASASSQLEQFGLFDEFVFTEISWGPKAPMVDRIVTAARFQRSQVLFVDDNPRLRAEVSRQCGVVVADPVELDTIDLAAIHETDAERRRLRRYRTMERRDEIARQGGSTSVRDFLRTCDLHVYLDDPAAHKARLVELAARANQLNFTKRVLTASDLDRSIADPDMEVRSISTRDRFGSYGTVGLYVLDRPRHSLHHFVFSCRLLNTWVEHAVHQHLGHPDLLVGDGLGGNHLATEEDIDWVTISDGPPPPEPTGGSPGDAVRVVLIGGCDLEAMATYVSVDHDVNATWHVPQVIDGVRCELQSSLLFLDPASVDHSDVFAAFPSLANWRPPPDLADAELVVLSLWAEIGTTRMRHPVEGWSIPWLPGAPPPVEGEADLPAEAGNQLKDVGPLTVPEVGRQLVRFAASLRPGVRLVVLNLPEIDEGTVGQRASELNRTLDYLKKEGWIDLVDVRIHVRSAEDLAGDGVATHYARPVYARLAAEIRRLADATRKVRPA